jgi:hypothetical protein
MNRSLAIWATICFVLTVGAIVSGCTKHYVASDSVGLAGEYVLVSVDGNNLPATVSHGGAALKVLSGVFTINSDGTCNSKTVFVPPTGNEIEREVAATYTIVGSELTMQWEGAGVTVGNVEGDTFTMDNEGMVFVYRK